MTGAQSRLHDGEPVRFEAADGVRLQGRLFGTGKTAVVASHMGRGGDSQLDWVPLARLLARNGYRVLTYNRRGVCNSGGGECSSGTDDLAASWRDVVGAARFVRARGATRVVLLGASIGAMSSLYAAARRDLAVAGVIEIGGINDASGYSFRARDLRRIEGAKLFASSRGDVYGGAPAARQWHGWAQPPKELHVLPGDLHGTDLLRPGEPTRPRLERVILDFLAGAARRVFPGALPRGFRRGRAK